MADNIIIPITSDGKITIPRELIDKFELKDLVEIAETHCSQGILIKSMNSRIGASQEKCFQPIYPRSSSFSSFPACPSNTSWNLHQIYWLQFRFCQGQYQYQEAQTLSLFRHNMILCQVRREKQFHWVKHSFYSISQSIFDNKTVHSANLKAAISYFHTIALQKR